MGDGEARVGDRIVSDGDYATIRFIGEVPPTKGGWYGVEWDNPDRGKHDGTHEGKLYFTTSHPKSGSFIRPKKVDLGVDFFKALTERYGLVVGGGIIEEEMYVRGKNQHTMVEVVGAESLNKKQSKFEELKDVALIDAQVRGAGTIGLLAKAIPNLEELDLTKNLLSSWCEVSKITEQLQHLCSLNLSSNRLEIPEDVSQLSTSFSSMRKLYLNRMGYTWDQIMQCMLMWPGLRELHLCFNQISSTTVLPSQCLHSLTLLNLEGNKLSSWQEILNLGNLKELDTLILNETGVSGIRFDDVDCGQTTSYFPSLKSLSLYCNNISTWNEVNELNKLQMLTELTIRRNPFLENIKEETARQLLVAKLERLQLLNRSEVSAEERKGAEIDYMRAYGKEWKQSGGHQDSQKNKPSEEFCKNHPRYQAIIERYGAPEDSELVKKTTALKNNLLNITIMSPYLPDKAPLSKKLPASMSVQKLKTLVQRLYKLNSDLDIYLSYSGRKVKGPEIDIDNDLRDIGYFGVEDGDTVHVTWR